mmetsp:Transcript_32422/g.70797  ORF Transcript_32422/g.70797 Transcript_32422/m.70797 type:complete len:339 (+) Transcript_32422:511-1527(+)
MQPECLLSPVGGAHGVGGCGKQHLLVRGVLLRAPEVHVEPPTKARHLSLLLAVGFGRLHRQLKRLVHHLDVVDAACVEVELLEDVGGPDALVGMDVHPRAGLQEVLRLLLVVLLAEALQVDAVLLVGGPREAVPVAQRVLVVHVLLRRLVAADRRQEHAAVARVQGTARLQPLVACNQDGVQHGLAEEEIAHPLGDDDVHLLRELELLHVALHDLDFVAHAVILRKGFGMLCHVRRLNGVHFLGAGLGGPDGENPASRADIQYNLVLELGFVLEHRVVIRLHANLVLEHLLLMIQESICAEIVGEVAIGNVGGLDGRHRGDLFGRMCRFNFRYRGLEQ